jgi:FkbM family methyltransferase
MKALLKRLVAMTPYRIVRDEDMNRFQAVEACLRQLRGRGYCPDIVIDGGAHLGTFSEMARRIYPTASFHLVEPQPACQAALRALCAREGFTLHPYALGETSQPLRFAATDVASTGAHVADAEDGPTIEVPTRTLDQLFATPGLLPRPLLKLDLQGFEMHALRGGKAVLPRIEVILTEVSFFRQAYEPSISDLVNFLDERGFEFYDVASLSARARDNRLHQGDFVFVRRGSDLLADAAWG